MSVHKELYRHPFELSGMEAIKLIRKLDPEDRLDPDDAVCLVDEALYHLSIYEVDIPNNFGDLPLSWFKENGLNEYLFLMKAVIDTYEKKSI